MNYLQCTDCGSDDIVQVYSDGEWVCRKCGLVVQNHIFDDRAPPSWCALSEHYDLGGAGAGSGGEEDISERGGGSAIVNYCQWIDINKQGVSTIQKLYSDSLKKMDFKPRGDNMKAFIAACIYVGCEIDKQSRPIEDICRVIGVGTKAFHQMCGVVRGAVGASGSGGIAGWGGEKLLIRMLNKIGDPSIKEVMLDDKKKWKLIKTCKSIHAFANKSSIFRGKMPSKTNAAVIFIACMAMKIKITKKVIANDLGVSVVTLSEHEKLIIAMKEDKGLGA